MVKNRNNWHLKAVLAILIMATGSLPAPSLIDRSVDQSGGQSQVGKDTIARVPRKNRFSKRKQKVQTKTGKTIIWDLGKTLFKPSKMHIARKLGLSDVMAYVIGDRQGTENLKERLFTILDELDCKLDTYPAATAENRPLPGVMCDWFMGSINGKDICKLAAKHIEKLRAENFFINEREARLLSNTCTIMFDPAELAHSMRPIESSLSILKQCYAQKDSSGKQLHNLFVLSNWDADSYGKLSQLPHGQRVFKYFDPSHIVISAHINLIKPDCAIFEYMVKQYKLDRNNCIFIDDDPANIAAARKCGFTGLCVEDQDFRKLKRELKKLNVI